jgi:hypothetical protein
MEIQLNIEMTPKDYAYTLYIKFQKSTYYALFHVAEIKKILMQERIFETEHFYHQVEIELKKL